ncbi:MAG: type I restriction enzyme HsdR N-terminal domain-containing protein [Chloroflexota bacterium]|nr:type I restriction enzyme HsdR N-terminal domain-containing protein [Chloroflexota bacterium]
MPLEDLLNTIEALRGRIQAHGAALAGNETQTRYALIDPLLQALGWNTADPSQVVPEYSASGGRADYALLNSHGKPTIMVEAKRLNRPLQDGLSQSIAYCVEQGTPYFCVTDGRRYAIYETFRQVAVNEKLVTQFDLQQDAPGTACLKALALWRPSVAEGHVGDGESPVTAAREEPDPSVVEPTDALEDTRRITRHKQHHTQGESEPDPMAPPPDGGKPWVRLSELRVEAHAKPEWLLPPSGTQVSVPSWTEFVARLTQWLVDVGRLSELTSPIQVGKRYVLAPEPIHPDGKAFRRVQRAGPLYIETNYSGADTIRNALLILKRAETQARDFRVRLAD